MSKVNKDGLAFFAVLIFLAAKKDNHLNCKEMFNLIIFGTFYQAQV